MATQFAQAILHEAESLPLLTRLAFAAKSVRRAFPILTELWPSTSKPFLEDIDRFIACAEKYAQTGEYEFYKPNSTKDENWSRPFSDGQFSTLFFARKEAADAVYNGAIAIRAAAHYRAAGAGDCSYWIREALVMAIRAYAIVAESDPLIFGFSRLTHQMRRDLTQLRELSVRDNWTDDRVVGSDYFLDDPTIPSRGPLGDPQSADVSADPTVSVAAEIAKMIRRKDVAFFVGAGISVSAGLPLASELINGILALLPLSDTDRVLVSKSRLPFEAFLEIIAASGSLESILKIFDLVTPNLPHRLIAAFVKAGLVENIFTTNFDELVEASLKEQGLEAGVDFNVLFEEAQFVQLESDPVTRSRKNVVKIHGTYSTKESIRTTLDEVAARRLSQSRAVAIRHLFVTGSHRVVIILGYSCSDEFDLNPSIRELAIPKNIEANLGTIRLKRRVREPEATKRILLIKHTTDNQQIEISPLCNVQHHLFSEYKGEVISCNTDQLLNALHREFNDEIICVGANSAIDVSESFQWKLLLELALRDILGRVTGGEYIIAGRLLRAIGHLRASIVYYEKALVLRRNQGQQRTDRQAAIILDEIADVYESIGDYDAGIVSLERSLEIAEAIGDSNLASAYYRRLAVISRKGGKSTSRHSHESTPEPSDDRRTIFSHLASGVAAFEQGRFESAINIYQQVLAVVESEGDKRLELNCLHNLGNAYAQLGEIDGADYFCRQAMTLAIALGDVEAEADTRLTLANLTALKGMEEEAVKSYLEAAHCYDAAGSRLGYLQCQLGIGATYLRVKKYSAASEFLTKATNVAREINDCSLLGQALFNLGSVSYFTNDLPRCIQLYLQALREFHKAQQDHAYKQVCQGLANAYEKLANYVEAAKYRRMSDGMDKSMVEGES
jgi:tetratricopeptide (TPR) repeat protein/NAD-dependent SIR2 family protein deacetylase